MKRYLIPFAKRRNIESIYAQSTLSRAMYRSSTSYGRRMFVIASRVERHFGFLCSMRNEQRECQITFQTHETASQLGLCNSAWLQRSTLVSSLTKSSRETSCFRSWQDIQPKTVVLYLLFFASCRANVRLGLMQIATQCYHVPVNIQMWLCVRYLC